MAETTTIRVTRELYQNIKLLAKQENENIQSFLEHAVNEYKRKKFFEEMDSAFQRLRSDSQAWEEEMKEREEWEGVIADGLEDDRWA